MRIRRLVCHALHWAPPTSEGAAQGDRHPRAVAPLVLLTVSGVIAAAVATGEAAVAAAAPRHAVVAPAMHTTLVAQGDVARALRALSDPGEHGSQRASRSQHRRPLHRWVRPNYGPLTSPYGYRWGRLHAGIDLAGPYGSPILAATDGCITYAGPESGYGEVMKITDWDGTETLYGHMSSFVRRSGCVKAGQVIARVGAEGDATGAHLHFEVHVGGVPVNPIPFLAKRGLYI